MRGARILKIAFFQLFYQSEGNINTFDSQRIFNIFKN